MWRERKEKPTKSIQDPMRKSKRSPYKGIEGSAIWQSLLFCGKYFRPVLIATESSLFVCYNWLVGRLFCIFNDYPMKNDENNQKARRISHETKEKTR